MLKLRWLEAFRAVVDAGTVTEASRRLHMTQPGVSRMITSLEYELGFRLFIREKGRLVITTQGHSFYTEVDRVLGGLEDIERVGRNIRTGGGARIRLIAMTSLVEEVLPIALERLREEYPTLRISLEKRGPRDMQSWQIGAAFDLGLVILPFDQIAARSHPFARGEAQVLMPASHRLAEHAMVEMEDYLNEPLVMLPSHSLLRRWLDSRFLEIGREPVITVETNSIFSACRMVGRGLGLTIVDPLTIRVLDMEGLAVRPLSPAFCVKYSFVLPPSGELGPHIRRLMTLIEETTATLLGWS